MKHKLKRFLAIFLTVLMVGTSIPTAAFASVSDGLAQNSISESIPNPESLPQEDTDTDNSASGSDSTPPDVSSTPSPASSLPPTDASSLPTTSTPTKPDSTPPAESESSSLPDTSGSSSAPASSTPESLPTEELPPEEETIFLPLSITEMSATFAKEIGETADFFVRLNRDDVEVTYQWQQLGGEPVYDGSGEAVYDYDSGESTRYIFPFEGISEAELLARNPAATWPGIEIYLDQLKRQRSNEPIVIAPNTPNYVLDSEAAAAMNSGLTLDAADTSSWENIDGATQSEYQHTVTAEDANSFYRCMITITDEAYIAAAAADAEKQRQADVQSQNTPAEDSAAPALLSLDANSEQAIEETAPTEETTNSETQTTAETLVQTTFTTDSMHIELPAVEKTPKPVPKKDARLANGSLDKLRLSLDNQWIEWLTTDMEYITADSYLKYGSSAANNAYWTKLDGGDRPDNSVYAPTTLTNDGNKDQMEVLSAWYGKTVYFRMQGNSGKGKSIDIPAYTSEDYQTGKKALYKTAVKILNAYIPDSGASYYATYLNNISDANKYLLDNNGNKFSDRSHIVVDKVRIEVFNQYPLSYLTDAEGNYKYDLVAIGVCTEQEPDISGAAAWALKDYLAEGYGFMVGHDTMYGYGGVTDASYVPDKNSSITPCYRPDSKIDGHWNVNWLMGVNKLYTQASPYEAPSMILNIGDYTDKSTLYGDGSGDSRLRIKKIMPGQPIGDISARCPTNYPYANYDVGTPITLNSDFAGTATHTNQQMAYGDIWLDYASNSLSDMGLGKLVTDTKNGRTGTNNFYLTTSGNFGMNQIGHIKDNQNVAQPNEVYILANTIMYLSQRQQCQVCQSAQGGNEAVHFVRKISSVEQLNMLRDQTSNWYNYPLNGCYMLSADITLPADWQPIQLFSGHFNADGHSITVPDGKSMFLQAGTLGEHTDSLIPGWNLGTDKTKGYNKISSANGAITTGTARSLGYLQDLFGTGQTINWSNKIVVIDGSDGTSYACKTNIDGKYVLSNLPCTGVMNAHVYDTADFAAISAANEITQYGKIRVNIPDKFWSTNETTPLYLVGFKAKPVQNATVYEGQTAQLINGGVFYSSLVTDITWQARKKGETAWTDVSAMAGLSCTVTPPVFHSDGDESWTETKLSVQNCKELMDGWQFRAVFKNNLGGTVDTYGVGTPGNMGLLTVKPRPIYITQAANQSVFADETATFTSTSEYWKSFTDGVQVRWQYKIAGADWADVEGSGLFPSFAVNNTSLQNGATTDTSLAPHKNTSVLSLNHVDLGWNNYKFQAVYTFDYGSGRKYWQSSAQDATGREGRLNVKPSTITATQPQSQKVTVNYPAVISPNTVTYRSTITYCPGKVGGAATPAAPTIKWQYKNKLSGMPYKDWNQGAATALYPASGITVTITNSAPVATANPNEYKVDSTMTIRNIPVEMDKGETHFWFVARAETTHLNKNLIARSENADLSVDYSIDIKHKEPISTCNPDQSSTTRYPNLEIYAPQGLRTIKVQFSDPNRDVRDRIYSYEPMPDGVTLSGDQYGYTFTSQNLIAASTWQAYVRTLHFVVFDGETELYWRIDENATDLTFSSSNGHFYEYVPSDGITWTDAYTAARGRYNADLDVNGYLATITGAQEQQIAQGLAKGSAWMGGTNVGTGGAYMYWQEYSGNLPFSYTNWAAGEPSPMTGDEYAAMRTNGQWEASGNTKTVNVTVRDVSPNMNNQGISIGAGSKSGSAPLVSGHQYYIATSCGDYGDANTAVTFQFDAFGLYVGDAGNPYISTEYSTILPFSGASGEHGFTFKNGAVGTDITGNYGYIYYIDIIDLTDAYGAGNEPSVEFCDQNFKNMLGEKTYTNVSAVSDKAGYLVEYGTSGNSFKRSNHTAYDLDLALGCGTTPTKRNVTVSISAISKVYDGFETNAIVRVTDENGDALPVADANRLLSGMQVSYNPTGKVTAANMVGSGAVHAKNYTATVSLAPSSLSSFDSISPYGETAGALKGSTGAFIAAQPSSLSSFDSISPYGETAGALKGSTGAFIAAQPSNTALTELYNITFADEGRCTFGIQARGLKLVSTDNNKVYDGNTAINLTSAKISIAAKNGDTGVIAGDTVAVAGGVYAGDFADIHQTNGVQSKITRSTVTPISLVNNSYGDYYIGGESYTGKITPRALAVHSKYLDIGDTTNNPRNVKVYDGNTAATIKNILVDNTVSGDTVALNASAYAGTYATKNSGENLKQDGTVQADRLFKLTENSITRTAPISLINNEYGDYVIGTESYSGAICRNTLDVTVVGINLVYGEGMQGKTATNAPRYSNTVNGHGTNLVLSLLAPGDELVPDDNKSQFVYPAALGPQSPVGLYKMDYLGLTEANYSVLSNYILWYKPSYVSITPRTVRFTVDGGYEKKYGEVNPAFAIEVENVTPGAENADGSPIYAPGLGVPNETLASAFDGELSFITSCNWQSDVIWASDNRTHLPYPVHGTGLTPKKNRNDLYNYEVEWVSGGVTVHPTEVTITPSSKTKIYGSADPAFEFTLSRPRVKHTDLRTEMGRYQGEDVGLYEFYTSHFYDPNYIIFSGPKAYLEITPAILFVSATGGRRLYGEENPELKTYYAGFKRGDDAGNAIEGEAVAYTLAQRTSDAGEYAVSPRGMSVKRNRFNKFNYDLGVFDNTLFVDKLPIDVYTDNVIKHIGEADPALTWHLGEGQQIAEDLMGVYVYPTRLPGEVVDMPYNIYSCPKEIELHHDDNCAHWLQYENYNYNITYHPGTLTVKPYDKLVASIKPSEKIYGEANPTDFELTYTLNGKAVTDISTLGITGTPVFTTDCALKSYVGEYDVSVSGITSSKYPDFTVRGGKLQVKPRPMTLTCDYFEKRYGQPNPVITYHLKDDITGITYDGLDPAARVNEGDLQGKVNWIDEFGELDGVEVNTFFTVPGELSNDTNYVITNIPEEYVVRNSTLQISMPTYRKFVGEENPKFEVIVSGFEYGDTLETVASGLYFKTTCTKDSPAGNYRITPLGFDCENKYGMVNYNTITNTTFIYVTERPTT